MFKKKNIDQEIDTVLGFIEQVKREKWPITTNYCPCDLFSVFHEL